MKNIIAASYERVQSEGSQSVVTYTASSVNIPNPERGFYKMVERFASSGVTDLNDQDIVSWRTNDGISLIMLLFYLDSFKNGSSISSQYLTQIQDDFNKVRQAGLKAIVRFAYTDDTAANPTEPVLANILPHITQLQSVVNNNRDVIATMQQGFIGAYGEGYYTTHFGNTGTVNTQQQLDRNSVLQAMLTAFDSSLFVQVRTTKLIKAFLGDSTPLSQSEAFTGTARARIGHHNDAFESEDADNAGTYEDYLTDKPYVRQIGRFTPIVGEAYDDNGNTAWGTACSNSVVELAYLHYSSIHIDYNTAIVGDSGRWETQQCRPAIRKNLGYRLRLTTATFPDTASSSMAVSMIIVNDGYANVYNQRDTIIVFRDTTSADEYPVQLTTDCRLWTSTQNINQALDISTVPNGEYDLFLNMPDKDPTLAANPEYSIQLANTGLWEPSTGYNALNHTITIT